MLDNENCENMMIDFSSMRRS